jgi:hypothetical protein
MAIKFPIEAKIATATPANNVKVEIRSLFNPNITLRIFSHPVICSSFLSSSLKINLLEKIKCYNVKILKALFS